MTRVAAEEAGIEGLSLTLVQQVLLNVLTRTQGRPQMSRVRVGRVLRATVEILDDPIKPTSQIILRPSLDVVQVQLLRALLLPVELDRVATGHHNLDVLEALFLEVLISVEDAAVLISSRRRLIRQHRFQLSDAICGIEVDEAEVDLMARES